MIGTYFPGSTFRKKSTGAHTYTIKNFKLHCSSNALKKTKVAIILVSPQQNKFYQAAINGLCFGNLYS